MPGLLEPRSIAKIGLSDTSLPRWRRTLQPLGPSVSMNVWTMDQDAIDDETLLDRHAGHQDCRTSSSAVAFLQHVFYGPLANCFWASTPKFGSWHMFLKTWNILNCYLTLHVAYRTFAHCCQCGRSAIFPSNQCLTPWLLQSQFRHVLHCRRQMKSMAISPPWRWWEVWDPRK